VENWVRTHSRFAVIRSVTKDLVTHCPHVHSRSRHAHAHGHRHSPSTPSRVRKIGASPLCGATVAPRARRKQRASRPGSSSEAPASPRVPRRRPSNMRPTTRPTSTKRRPSLTFRGRREGTCGRGSPAPRPAPGAASRSQLSGLRAARARRIGGGELGARCELRARCASWRRSWRRVAPCPPPSRRRHASSAWSPPPAQPAPRASERR